MLDLPHFYTTHRDRLAKWLPEAFKPCRKSSGFYLDHVTRDVEDDCYPRLLPDSEASIFLEHAARRVLEEEGWSVEVSPTGSPTAIHLSWHKGSASDESYSITSSAHLEALAAALDASPRKLGSLDTLFPPPQEPG